MALTDRHFGKAHVTVEYVDENDTPTQVFHFTADKVLYTKTREFKLVKGIPIADHDEFVIRWVQTLVEETS